MQYLGYGSPEMLPVAAFPQDDVAGITAEERALSGQYVRRQEMPGLINAQLGQGCVTEGAARGENMGYPPLLRQLGYLIEHLHRGYLNNFRTALKGALLTQDTSISG
jgi:hypothetical protein